MAQCPNCGTTLKDDYGMSQCTKCGLFSFIDMEGNAFINAGQDADPSAATGTKAPPVPTSTRIPAPPPPPADAGMFGESKPVMEESGAFEFPQENVEVAPPVVLEMPDEQPVPFGSDFGGEPGDLAPAMPEQSFAPTENPGEQDFQPFSFDPAPEVAPEEAPIPDLGPADDPLGLAKFANSEISSAKDGPLLFRVFVSGIDSKEMREIIREVLEDPRFGWDADQMFARLEKGVLTIENLSPVKASILVTRIKRLPVKIRWEQYAVSQVDSTQ